jgi:hypothetical protein
MEEGRSKRRTGAVKSSLPIAEPAVETSGGRDLRKKGDRKNPERNRNADLDKKFEE